MRHWNADRLQEVNSGLHTSITVCFAVCLKATSLLYRLGADEVNCENPVWAVGPWDQISAGKHFQQAKSNFKLEKKKTTRDAYCPINLLAPELFF